MQGHFTTVLCIALLSACGMGGTPSGELSEASGPVIDLLVPVKVGGTYQYVDAQGQVRIPPKFGAATLFHDGLAAVIGPGGTWGYIDASGEFKIGPKYKWATAFKEGYAWVVHEGGEPIAIDKQGRELFTLEYGHIARLFHDGVATCDIFGKGRAQVHPDGRVVFEADLPAKGDFFEGLAVKLDSASRKYGFIDAQGNVVIAPAFEQAMPFKGGKAVVAMSGKWGVIDRSGKLLVPARFDEVEADGNSYRVSLDGRAGWCDASGNIVIKPQFAETLPFGQSDLAPVTNGSTHTGPYGFVDREGHMVVQPQYKRALPFFNGYAFVMVDPNASAFSDGGKWGVIDRTGAFVVDPTYDEIAEDAFFALLSADLDHVSVGYYAVRSEYFDPDALAATIDLYRPEGIQWSETPEQVRGRLDTTHGASMDIAGGFAYYGTREWARNEIDGRINVYGGSSVDSVSYYLRPVGGSLGKKDVLADALLRHVAHTHAQQGPLWTSDSSVVRVSGSYDHLRLTVMPNRVGG